MRTWVLAAVATAVVVGCGAPQPDAAPAGEVTLTPAAVNDIAAAIDAQKGKVVLVDFWATWCGPCVRAFPHVVDLHKKYAADGLVCISASLDDEDDGLRVLSFLKERRATFQNLHWKTARTQRRELVAGQEKFGFTGSLPYQMVIDRTGRRVWDNQSTAFASDAMLDELIRNLLAAR